jgi:hypothetical protein
MSKMRKPEIKQMLNYYYIDNNVYEQNFDKNKIEEKINFISNKLDDCIKPSKLEEMCSNNDLNELYEKIDSLTN